MTQDYHFKPVHVSADRIIRQVAGLRPFRPSGFVVRAETVMDKTIIHNYGHGGGGMSLSWGTAKMATDLAVETQRTSYAVLGCGVIGLSTARLLQRRGFQVTIYSKDLPPDTTSNVSGALWAPVSVFDKNKVGNEFLTQFKKVSAVSQRMFQDFVGAKYGVRWIRNFYIGNTFEFPGGKELYPGYKKHHDARTFFGHADVTEISTLMIEPPIYLNALMTDFYLAGGKIAVKEFNSIKDVAQLEQPVIMNCTGLGSEKLFKDDELVPEKGQLNILLPQQEIDYAYVASFPNNYLYMFPRKDGIILGGTHDLANWSLEPDPSESERILKGHRMISESLQHLND